MKLLDTTFLVDVLRREENARRAIAAMEETGERPATTEVNAFELALGAYRRGRIDPVRLAAVDTILNRLDVLPLDRDGALRAADILAKLRAEGKEIGLLDALIAGVALASGCEAIVTRDDGFRRVAGLKVQGY